MNHPIPIGGQGQGAGRGTAWGASPRAGRATVSGCWPRPRLRQQLFVTFGRASIIPSTFPNPHQLGNPRGSNYPHCGGLWKYLDGGGGGVCICIGQVTTQAKHPGAREQRGSNYPRAKGPGKYLDGGGGGRRGHRPPAGTSGGGCATAAHPEAGFAPCLPLVNLTSIQLLPREVKPSPAALHGPARTPVVWWLASV